MTQSHARRPTRASARPKPEQRGPGWLRMNAAEGVSPRWTGWAFRAVMAATAAILLWIILGPHRVGDYFTETDFYGAYAEGARMLQHGHLDPSRYAVVGPVYEIVLALFGFPVRDLFLAAELISLLATCGTLLLWFALLRRRLSPAVGLWTALFLAANPTFLRYGYSATTDALATFLQAAALFALLGMGGARAPLWAGLLSALAALTRYNAVYLLPGAALCFLWLGRPEGRSRAGALALYSLGFVLLAVPWLVFSVRHGQGPGTALFHNIAYDVYARAHGITWDDYQAKMQAQFHSLWDVIRRDPPAVARRELQNVVEHFRQDLKNLLGWPSAIVCGVGLILALIGGGWRRMVPVWACGALLFLTLVPAFYSERYSLPLAPVYLTLAGLAVGSRLAAIVVRGVPVPLKWVAALWPLWLAAQSSAAYQSHLFTQLPVEVITAGESLRGVASPGAMVLARKPHVAYYAGLKAVAFPSVTTLAELADYCHRNRVEFLYFSWPEAETRPQFWYLLDTSAVVPGLHLLRFVPKNPAAIYRVGPEFGRKPAWFDNDTLLQIHSARAQLLVNPLNYHAQFVMGLYERAHGRPAQALAHFEAMTRAQPRTVDGWILSGEACLILGQLDRAEEAYMRALELDPQNLDAHVGLGWVYLSRAQPQRAAQEWRPAIPSVDDVPTLQQMAQLFERLGDGASARAARDALARQAGRR